MRKYLSLNNIGLFLNIAGTLLITYALGDFPDGGTFERLDGGTQYGIVYFKNPFQFKLGIILLIIGFFFQLTPKSK
ncbi:hypothetical protein A2333_02165 [Candidatus Wolfebacteria bacterium RIFOXYB2_FULL_49_7]|uniref:Uncharacterized protein n=2 Tax=Candidatus Wolfeibacteriota TaxID=1752735 RepID=A0A1F8DXV2_9BACT|nr:MAG: hypothetical protein A2372_03265 [Candidatus Wolfebacteria bacterium RIFOXYB1_FULL_54_12]OGM93666.1 MAG: hypothetical protein A2610_00260 [Candidatus Wolfebacteria bacterium RIFOXYD1_FULL_48_65]OGM95161.1 MAG: hypothetical protein A2524_03720 [Candidatus Wolfebacteria bacterium RIFOXYD12_FULL_48_21]OGM95518.1 MAG: hypothetical protein A2333_02165 [Candidatus Wolfebacteria bacterium RIFOXYB2_FULL_49_7]OGM95747.1 MAG: hypothetical protein A2532_03475 [Candidatus Wolfebacteria bacterium RI